MNPENLLKLTKIILALKEKVKCPICLDFVENTVQLGCAHQFCNDCLQELRLQNTPLCPLCKVPINKRTAVYKDQFADDLSKFVDHSCQLFKETYAHEVDKLFTSNKTKLQEIIDSAPKDIGPLPTSSKTPKSAEFKKPTLNAFNKLAGQPRCYTNKKRQAEQKENRKVLNFSNNDNKTKIINWLNDNQEKLDTLTQSPSFLVASDDEADFELPSISQVAYQRKQNPNNRVRSQSLTLVDNMKEPLLKRYHSLTQGLEDDYDIDEVHSETLVKQVERKVLQDMLEDECLANLDHLAQKNKDKLKKEKVAPKKAKKSVSKNKTSNVPNSGSSSGWDRIKDVKKSIKKATKEPKKLNISLQESNTKKSPKGGTKQSEVERVATKINKSPMECPVKKSTTTVTRKSIKANTTVHNKENEICHKKVDPKVDISIEPPSHTFNLSAVETYFEQNIDKVKVTPDKNTSSDMEIGRSAKKLKDWTSQNRKSPSKENIINQNTSDKDKSVDDEIFCMATQITAQSADQSKQICYVAPVPKDLDDIDSIAVRLTDNLRCCISSALNLNNDLSYSLVECFTNLKTYIDKILTRISDRKEEEMQTSEIQQVNKKTRSVQTETVRFSCKVIQTNLSPVKKLITKNIQTSQNLLQNAEVQTDITICVDQGVQATECLPTRRITKEKSVEKMVTHSTHYSLSPPDTSPDGVSKSKSKICKQTITYRVAEPEDIEKEIFMKTSQSSDIQEKHISVDSSKPSKTKSREISQESFLICSVGLTASNKSDKKINRKLTYGETQNRAFKRIRMPKSDSESDDDAPGKKRRLVRDDLTVEFVDTERGSKEYSQTKAAFTPESEKMDYDKYLLEVMAKYGTPPPEKTSGDKEQITLETKSNKSTTNKKQISQEQLNSQKKESQKSKKESQKDSGDHIFTAHMTFEKNLDKFEKEIFEYEHTTEAQNTEYDLVENTPMLSPKAKIPRLKTSTKKKETKKDLIKEPLEILRKGSAPAPSNMSKIKDPVVDDSLSNLTQSEPSTMNRNIENVASQTEKCTDDVAGILKDLQNDDDFFKTNMDCDDNGQVSVDLQKRQEKVLDSLGDHFGMDDLQDDLPVSKDNSADKENLNVTQENIDKVMKSLNGFEDGDDIEAELEKISFTAEQRKLSETDKNRIKILQNIKLRSQDKKRVAESPPNRVIESSDVSDEEIVETTPQKKKHNSKNRSLDRLEENSLGITNLDFCLPPPPGFGDELETSPVANDPMESPVDERDANLIGGNKSSLTPDSLTAFMVTPDTMMYREKVAPTQNDFSQQSLTFKQSFVTPSRPSKNRNSVLHSTPCMSQILPSDPGDMFSPITKSINKVSHSKYTPLVSTLRLSTRKSNLMTSTPNQKSILNYVKSSQDSPSCFQHKPIPCIMWTRIVSNDVNVFTQLEVKKLVTTANAFNPRVTHLVVMVNEKGQIVSHTAKILIAIAAGIWVVRYEWAQDCLKLNRIVPEEPYEALDTTGVPGPQISRLTRETKPLFKGYRFYCAAPLLTIPKSDLENILQLSGGEIARKLLDFLHNDGKINIILTESSASEDAEQFEKLLQVYKAVTIDVEWLTKCIGQYKLVSFRAFLVSGDDSNICDLGYPPTLVESVPFTLTEAM